MARRSKQVFWFLICLVVLMVVNYYPDKYSEQFTQKIVVINDKSKFIKVPFDQNVAVEHTKKRMKLPTFVCRPIPGGAKLFDVFEYDLEHGHSEVKINIQVVKDYFNSSSSIECSLQKFGKKENTASKLENRGQPIVLDSKNKYQMKIPGYG